MNSIFTRKSIRKYEKRFVEPEKVELLLKAAMAAPSAGNQRAWEFIVVTDEKILQQLSSASPYATPMKEAPLGIIVLANTNEIRHPKFPQQDLAAASENILLEAVELGLGAVWLGIAPAKERMEKVSEILGIPKHVEPFAMIPVGYPVENRIEEDRYDCAKVHYNRY